MGLLPILLLKASLLAGLRLASLPRRDLALQHFVLLSKGLNFLTQERFGPLGARGSFLVPFGTSGRSFLAPVLLPAFITLGRNATLLVASFDDMPWARTRATFLTTKNFVMLASTSHCDRWRFGAVVALKRFGRFLQLPIVGCGRFP